MHNVKAYARIMGLRSIYSLALREDKVLSGPNSLEEVDPAAAPPGTGKSTPQAGRKVEAGNLIKDNKMSDARPPEHKRQICNFEFSVSSIQS